MPEKNKDQPRSLFYSFCRGAVGGFTETVCNYWLFSLKLLLQSKEDTSTHPVMKLTKALQNQQWVAATTLLPTSMRALYKGSGLYALSLVPTTGIQTCVRPIIEARLAAHTHFEASNNKLLSGFTAGAIAAVFASPTEYIITQFRINKSGQSSRVFAIEFCRERGFRTVTHGLLGTALRDGVFVVGYDYLIPLVRARVQEHQKNPLLVALYTNIIVGIVTGILSHPADTVKSFQQESNRHHFFRAFSICYQEGRIKNPKLGILGGLPEIYRGFSARALRLILALGVIEAAMRECDRIFTPGKTR